MAPALALALAAALAAPPAPPAARAAFAVDDLLAIPRVASPALSPDGKLIAFTVARAAPDGARFTSSLWLVAVAGGAPRRLTFAEGERVGGPRWSPDGRRIAFVSSRGGSSQAFILPLDGGEAVQATRLASEVNDLLWTPDGGSLVVTSDVDPACGADDACNAASEAAAKARPHLAKRLLYRHGNTWRERRRSHLLRVPLAGGTAVDLTPGDRDVPPFDRGGAGDLTASADGREVLFAAVSDPVEATSTNADIYGVPLAGGPARRITSGAGWDGTPRPSQDGKLLAWRSQARAGYEADKDRLLVAAPGGAPRDLTAALDASVHELFWAPGGRIVFTANEGGTSNLYDVEVSSGQLRRLLTGANLHGLSPSRDGRIAAGLVDGMAHPSEVVVLEEGKVRVLTHFADEVLGRVALGTVQPLEAKGKDGAAVHGWIVTPPGRAPGERLPAVVLVHGGPQGAWNDAWSYRWNPMIYAAQGYAVVLPNPRGSSGFGQAYQDAVRRNWGGTPYDDVMALTDAAVAGGAADGRRMCAAGASYGGYMVNWINGHTRRFRCLVAHAGDFNLESSYYDTEELWFPEWELGRPWEDRSEYERWSPHRFVGAWKTPTLVTHGELDYRVNVAQGLSTFTALQRLGVESQLLVFPDEGHWVLKPRNAKLFHEVVLRWLGDHLAGGAGSGASPLSP